MGKSCEGLRYQGGLIYVIFGNSIINKCNGIKIFHHVLMFPVMIALVSQTREARVSVTLALLLNLLY
jgi:hypothetical protein